MVHGQSPFFKKRFSSWAPPPARRFRRHGSIAHFPRVGVRPVVFLRVGCTLKGISILHDPFIQFSGWFDDTATISGSQRGGAPSQGCNMIW
jgi:hypothetical protein